MSEFGYGRFNMKKNKWRVRLAKMKIIFTGLYVYIYQHFINITMNCITRVTEIIISQNLVDHKGS